MHAGSRGIYVQWDCLIIGTDRNHSTIIGNLQMTVLCTFSNNLMKSSMIIDSNAHVCYFVIISKKKIENHLQCLQIHLLQHNIISWTAMPNLNSILKLCNNILIKLIMCLNIILKNANVPLCYFRIHSFRWWYYYYYYDQIQKNWCTMFSTWSKKNLTRNQHLFKSSFYDKLIFLNFLSELK